MGRIKTAFIKRITHEIFDKYPEKFSEDFEANKKSLEDVIAVRSKKLRNVIAGYLARLKKHERMAREEPSYYSSTKRRATEDKVKELSKGKELI